MGILFDACGKSLNPHVGMLDLKFFGFMTDFRHTAITGKTQAGIDHLTIMRISRDKTMTCFTRYHSVRKPDRQDAGHLI